MPSYVAMATCLQSQISAVFTNGITWSDPLETRFLPEAMSITFLRAFFTSTSLTKSIWEAAWVDKFLRLRDRFLHNTKPPMNLPFIAIDIPWWFRTKTSTSSSDCHRMLVSWFAPLWGRNCEGHATLSLTNGVRENTTFADKSAAQPSNAVLVLLCVKLCNLKSESECKGSKVPTRMSIDCYVDWSDGSSIGLIL